MKTDSMSTTEIVQEWTSLYSGTSYQIRQRPGSFERVLLEIQQTPADRRYRVAARWFQPGGASDKPILVPAEFMEEIVRQWSMAQNELIIERDEEAPRAAEEGGEPRASNARLNVRGEDLLSVQQHNWPWPSPPANLPPGEYVVQGDVYTPAPPAPPDGPDF